jgi:hypothetical protein
MPGLGRSQTGLRPHARCQHGQAQFRQSSRLGERCSPFLEYWTTFITALKHRLSDCEGQMFDGVGSSAAIRQFLPSWWPKSASECVIYIPPKINTPLHWSNPWILALRRDLVRGVCMQSAGKLHGRLRNHWFSQQPARGLSRERSPQGRSIF